jgi:uncharacterized protein YhfF
MMDSSNPAPPSVDSDVAAFWQRFRESRADNSLTYCEAFGFGNTPEMATELAALVVSGVKTATSRLLWEVEDDQQPQCAVGDLAVVLDGDGAPRAVIETVALWTQPFNAVDAAFAWEYGEGDRTLDWWQTHLWDYNARECARLNRPPAPDMPIICERFRLVYAES